MMNVPDELLNAFEGIQKRIGAVFDGLKKNLFQNEGNMRQPIINVWEKEKEVIIQADLPGMEKKDIHIVIEEDQVELKAEKKTHVRIEKKGGYREEEMYQSFYKKVPLPAQVDADRARSEFKSGTLLLTLPKKTLKKRKVLHLR